MRTICYVILNYKTYEEAAACAESILSTQTWKNMHIVIVDNGSGNGGSTPGGNGEEEEDPLG